jgi:hypothetical protein
VVKKLEKGSTVMRSTPQQQIKINIRKIQEKKKGHVAPPSSRLKKQPPRRKEAPSKGDCAINAKRRVIGLRITHKPAVLTRGGFTILK